MNPRAEIELKAKQFRNGEITIDEFNEFLSHAEEQQRHVRNLDARVQELESRG